MFKSRTIKNYNPKLFPLNAEGWMTRKKGSEMRRKPPKSSLYSTVGLQSAGILIEIKFPSLCISVWGGREIKTLAALKRETALHLAR